MAALGGFIPEGRTFKSGSQHIKRKEQNLYIFGT